MEARATSHRTRWQAAFVGLLTVLALTHIYVVFTENVNWDEFALLQRAETAARTGVVRGVGRPGLATMLLMPVARACVNGVDAIRTLRVWWLMATFGAAWAFWILLGAVVPRGRHAPAGRAIGLGLWLLAPPFLRFSVQVRTDQPAIALGLWGGVALLASRHRPAWAIIAGGAMGLGYLFTQKLVYVAGLAGIIVLAETLREDGPDLRRDLRRAGWFGLAFAGTLFAYSRLAASLGGAAPTMLGISSGLDAFAYYRQWVGWRYYRGMAVTLLPHLLLIVGLIPVTIASLRHRRNGTHRDLATGWVLLAAGTAVLLFHAGRFPYFYMTFGLFVAAIGAVVSTLALEHLHSGWLRRGLLAVVWCPLVGLGLTQTAALMEDTQERQRESLAFIDRNFSREVRGFEARGALVCRHDPDPFPVRFARNVNTEFAGDAGAAQGARLVDEFRERAVRFFISPFPSERYPAETWDFWRSRYTPYHAFVWLPGTRVGVETHSFEAVAPGPYRWLPDEGASGPITVGGTIVEPGQSVELTAGLHRIMATPATAGRFVLAVPEPGFPAAGTFYRVF